MLFRKRILEEREAQPDPRTLLNQLYVLTAMMAKEANKESIDAQLAHDPHRHEAAQIERARAMDGMKWLDRAMMSDNPLAALYGMLEQQGRGR